MDLNTISLKQPLNPKIYSNIAEQAADYITPKATFDPRKGKEVIKNRDANKSTQLRKYYDELAMWDDKIHRAADKNTEYQKSAPYIHMLKAKAAYAKGRSHVDDNFIAIFNRLLDQIDSAETLHHAKLFYEAMLGFRKAQESK